MNVLGIIPARGGSKGFPGKHLAVLGGRTLLDWTAAAAKGSRRLQRVIVSTDSEEIAAAARDLGLDVPFMRDAALARDETLILPVIADVLARLSREGYVPDAVALLQVTSPLRRAHDIDAAVDLLETSGADTVVSVVPVPHQYSPVSVMRMDDEWLTPFADGPARTRRQDKPVLYARNGPAVLVTRPAAIATGELYAGRVKALVMDAADSVDIDNPMDLAIAEALLAYRQRAELS